MECAIKWLTDWREIMAPDFLRVWTDLWMASERRNVFFHPKVALSWLAYRGGVKNVKPLFALAEFQDGNRLLLPMVYLRPSWKRAYLTDVVPIGYDLFDYCDPVGETNDESDKCRTMIFLSQLWKEFDQVITRCDALSITRLSGCGSPVEGLVKTDVAPYCSLDHHHSYEAFFSSLKKKHRYDIRRSTKELSERGELKLKVVPNDDEQFAIDVALRMLAARNAKYGDSVVSGKYLRNLIRDVLPSGLLHVSVLTCGKEQVAWHVGFVDGRKLYWYLPAYSEKLRSYSPGKLHLHYVAMQVFELGIREIDFLRGEESYKDQWCEAKRILLGRELLNVSAASRFKRTLSRIPVRLSYLKNYLLARGS